MLKTRLLSWAQDFISVRLMGVSVFQDYAKCHIENILEFFLDVVRSTGNLCKTPINLDVLNNAHARTARIHPTKMCGTWEEECCLFDHHHGSGGYIKTQYKSLTCRPPKYIQFSYVAKKINIVN